MQEIFAASRRFPACICLCVMALVGGCSATRPQVVPAPVFYNNDCQAAVLSGAQAMADCSREQVVSMMEKRAPDYSKARGDLARALVTLQPAKQNPSKPEYEKAAICFETALAAMDRIIVAQEKEDRDGAAIGWEMLDQSARSLLLVLDRQTANVGGGTSRR